MQALPMIPYFGSRLMLRPRLVLVASFDTSCNTSKCPRIFDMSCRRVEGGDRLLCQQFIELYVEIQVFASDFTRLQQADGFQFL